MTAQTGKLIIAAFLSITSGVLLFMGFPPFDLWLLPWIALVPLLLCIAGKGAVSGFFWALVFGITFLLGIFNWILAIRGYTLFHHAMLALYLGCFFGVFGLAFSFIARRSGLTTAFFSAPFVWVSLEYIRSNLSFLALPWGLIAHSQYQNPAVIQFASITGAYGVSFLVVLINSAIALLIYPFFKRIKKRGTLSRNEGRTHINRALPITAALLLVSALLYGHLTISKQVDGNEIKVSVIQANIDQQEKWQQKNKAAIMQTQEVLTSQAAKNMPDLIVWPETAIPGAINRNRWLRTETERISRDTSTFLLVGSAPQQKFAKEETHDITYHNSALLVSPKKGIVKNKIYHKIRLLPFSEYVPLKETVPWASLNIPDSGRYRPGNEFTIFDLPACRFAATICWENIFPDLVRKFVDNGAQFIVNITNEAWFGRTAAPYQFLAMSVFRAAENHVFVVRCANSGISCLIDPFGRVVDRVRDDKGTDIFVRGTLTGTVVPSRAKTIYTRFGDVFAWLNIFTGTMFFLAALIRNKVQTFTL